MQLLSYIWLVLAIVFFFIELITPAFFFLSLSAGAFVSFLLSLLWNNLTIQLLLFVAVFIIFFIYLKPVIYKKDGKEKFNAIAMIGTVAVAAEDIDHLKGTVKLNGSIWQARCMQEELKKGNEVVIQRIDGNKLIVIKK
ncbi:MAG: NfeD family protein [Sphaerochaetaceae bacterium]